MEKCRYTRTSRVGRFAAQYFYPVVGLLVCAYAILGIIDGILSGEYVATLLLLLLTIGPGFFLFWLSVVCYTFESREFALSKEGITLSDKKKPFYRWEEVHEVAIMDFGANASLDNYQTVICCFFKPRTDRISRKILRSYLYGARHKDSFVIIDYSTDILETLSSLYPGEIADCRKMQRNL